MASNKVCCDPFSKHAKKHGANLKDVTDNIFMQCRNLKLSGDIKIEVKKKTFICEDCRKRVSRLHGQLRNSEQNEECVEKSKIPRTSVPKSNVSDHQYDSATPSGSTDYLDLSPLQKHIIDVPDVKTKLNDLLRALNLNVIDENLFRGKVYKENLLSLLNKGLSDLFEFEANSCVDSVIIQQLKSKFGEPDVTREDQTRILSILPKSWSTQKMSQEFGVSIYLAKKVKTLVSKRGILYDMESKRGRPLDHILAEIVQEFYRSDNISRSCPGIKEYTTINENGVKEKVQRRLVMMNLNEAFEQFKIENPEKQIGFSKFAELRPKECVLAGQTHGIHVVCVCEKHQNVSLKFDALKKNQLLTLDKLNDVLNSLLCENRTEKCSLAKCTKCLPDSMSKMEGNLFNIFDEMGIIEMQYKQWLKVEGDFNKMFIF